MKIVMFLGSTRNGRMAERVAKFIQGHLIKKGFTVDVFDPVEMKFPMLENPIHFYPDQSKVPDWLAKLNDRVMSADGYVLVSPEYNNCVPPALTNMINHFPPNSYFFKSSLIVTYSMGRLGGSVCGSQLRSFTSILGCPSVPLALPIAEVHSVLDDAGNSQMDYMDKQATKAVEQLHWMTSAMKVKRDKDGNPPHVM